MSGAVFVHYVVCGDCKRQHRVEIEPQPKPTVVGVRCCRTAWLCSGKPVLERLDLSDETMRIEV
jgi:hypothetical protein